jgi:hypothetical protein
MRIALAAGGAGYGIKDYFAEHGLSLHVFILVPRDQHWIIGALGEVRLSSRSSSFSDASTHSFSGDD